ncbi:YjdF family protein [Devosia sp.]|uniref:YjdF family protein n=1 Tax=Devosia sp. TaxID=1871048 RepID=UPI001AD11C7D|nr:YjdF family protein [Devosia sp.]
MSSRTITSVFFDGQFWVAEIERHAEGSIAVARHRFGPEPTNAELLIWVDRDLQRLCFFDQPQHAAMPASRRTNPKRMTAKAENVGFSDKAAQAIKAALAERKLERKGERKRRSKEEQERIRALHRAKLKQKRRGR